MNKHKEESASIDKAIKKAMSYMIANDINPKDAQRELLQAKNNPNTTPEMIIGYARAAVQWYKRYKERNKVNN